MAPTQELELIDSRFPHIGRPLKLMWGEPEVAIHIDRLLTDTRGGTRRGFPTDVLAALMRIRSHHSRPAVRNTFSASRSSNPWGRDGFR
jgi:hypothetical protein